MDFHPGHELAGTGEEGCVKGIGQGGGRGCHNAADEDDLAADSAARDGSVSSNKRL